MRPLTRLTDLILLVLNLSAIAGENIGTFWQLSDFHVDTTYIIDNTTSYWGDYNKDTSTLVAFTAIETANDHGTEVNTPDFVMWTGNAAKHNGTSDEVIKSLQFLSNHFKQAFKVDRVPLLPVLGGHDVFPLLQMSPNLGDINRIQWCTKLADDKYLWSPWVDMANNSLAFNEYLIANFRIVCYHSRLVKGDTDILMIGLNSLVWASENTLVDSTIDDPLGQFKWLETSLKWARANKTKVVLISHHPLGYSGSILQKTSHLVPKYNDILLQYIREFHEEIIGIFAGHEHTDSFRVVLDNNSCPINTIFLAPSVNSLTVNGLGNFNPRIRQYVYSRESGNVKDYVQYALDLTVLHPEWGVEYTVQKEYNLTGDWHMSMAKLLDLFTTQDDPNNYWSSYWKHELGGRPHQHSSLAPDGYCPTAASKCRCMSVCLRRSMDAKSLQTCSKSCESSDNPILQSIDYMCNQNSNETNRVAMIAGIVIGILVLLVIFVVVLTIVYRQRRRSVDL